MININARKLPIVYEQRSYKRWLVKLVYLPVAAILYSEQTKTYIIHFINISDAMMEVKTKNEYKVAIRIVCMQFMDDVLENQLPKLKA